MAHPKAPGLVSRITASFMNPMISSAISTGKVDSDSQIDGDSITSEVTHDLFCREWEKEMISTSTTTPEKKMKNPSLLATLYRTFRTEIWKAAALKIGWGAFVLLSISFFVRQLLVFMRERQAVAHTLEASRDGFILAVFFFVSTVVLSVCLQQMNAVSSRLGVKVKAAVATAIYRKSLVADRQNSSGDIVSLVATDATKLAESCITLQFLWSGIVEALAIICVLLGFIGVSALPGLGLLLVLVPIQYAVGMLIAKMRKRVAQASDSRVQLMDEILRAVKLVKMYAWEKQFASNVALVRSMETQLARVGGYLKSLNLALVFVMPPLIAVAIFGTHEAEGALDGVFAFTALSMFNTLRLPLVQLPKGLRAMAEALAAAERIEKYLVGPNRTERKRAPYAIIKFENASFGYGSNPSLPKSTPALVQNLSLHYPRGTLAMIAGPVGSGKSNVLHAILGHQMTLYSGKETVGGNFAYVPQTPWCCQGTVRDNILFGLPWDEEKYRRVLFACALETDMNIMENGDLTEIGERGMNLSGGQKQRIALARAAYSNADTFLLDAPLSAVDMYTCQHIFKFCIRGIMRGSTVILVTHQTELFVHADSLMVMNNGSAAYVGPYTGEVLAKYFPNASALTGADTHVANAVAATTEQADAAAAAADIENHNVHGNSSSSASPATKDNQYSHGIITRAASLSRRMRSQSGLNVSLALEMQQQQQHTAAAGAAAISASMENQHHHHSHYPLQSQQSQQSQPPQHFISDALNPAGSVMVRAMSMRADILKTASITIEDEKNLRIVGSDDGFGGEGSENAVSRVPSLPRTPSSLPSSSMKSTKMSSMRIPPSAVNRAPTSTMVTTFTPSPDLILLDPKEAASATASKQMQIALAASAAGGGAAGGKAQTNGYFAFLKQIGFLYAFISIAIFVVTQVTRIYSDMWISVWVSKKYVGREEMWYVEAYGGYVGTFFALLLLRGIFYYIIGLRAASNMHNAMFSSILRAPMSYFTTTPLGRVLSVFSKDMDTIDELLLDNVHMVIIYFMILCTTLGVVIRILPVFAAIAGGLLLFAAYFFQLYIRSSRILKDTVGTTSSTVVAHTSETLQGMAVIQAYGAEERFMASNAARTNAAAKSTMNLEMLQLWLSFRLDFIGCALVLGTCLLCVALDSSLSPSNAGLAISNSFQILLFFSLMVRGAADINANIASVERVVKLSDVPQEKDVPLTLETCPPDSWPSKGVVDFHSIVMSYLPAAPHVLKGVTFNVRPGEKIGVVGRTGAGKSSLIMALFRLVEPSEGAVRIDGIDVSKLQLTELRRRIAIIPQEPVMFRGTLRSNLDPFEEHTDEQVWLALDRCLLGDMVRNYPNGLGLSSPVSHMGENYSLGQQQLLCLARAMLNPSKLLCLDEATAALDTDTDAAVQRVLRTHFADRTVITIAHRLDTIIDSDRILVMDAGKVVEFESPHTLLTQPSSAAMAAAAASGQSSIRRRTGSTTTNNAGASEAELLEMYPSIFAQLCRQTGAQYESLRAAATRHHDTMLLLQQQLMLADQERAAASAAGEGEADDDGGEGEEEEDIDDEGQQRKGKELVMAATAIDFHHSSHNGSSSVYSHAISTMPAVGEEEDVNDITVDISSSSKYTDVNKHTQGFAIFAGLSHALFWRWGAVPRSLPLSSLTPTWWALFIKSVLVFIGIFTCLGAPLLKLDTWAWAFMQCTFSILPFLSRMMMHIDEEEEEEGDDDDDKKDDFFLKRVWDINLLELLAKGFSPSISKIDSLPNKQRTYGKPLQHGGSKDDKTVQQQQQQQQQPNVRSSYEDDDNLLPAMLSLAGSWLGACVAPLDWDTEWQVWPIASTYGCMLGMVVGQVLTESKRFCGR